MSNFGAVNYLGVESVANSGAATDSIINLPSTANAITLGDDGANGNGLTRLSGSTIVQTDFSNPSSSLAINRGNPSDTLTINAMPDFNAAIAIGATGSPLTTVSISGAVSLALGNSLSVAATSLNVNASTAVSTSGAGNIAVAADNIAISFTANITAGNSMSIVPLSAGRAFDLGTNTANVVALTNTELGRITAAALQIGDANSGPFTVSAALTPGSNLVLTTGAGITLNNAVSMSANKSLTATAVGTINFANSSADLSTTGTGAISLSTTRDIPLVSGASVTTVNGNLSLSANQQPTPTSGNFVGVKVNGATVRVTGTGLLSVLGRGGDDPTGTQYGIHLLGTGKIWGGTSGLATVTGTGGASAGANNYGVYVTGSSTQLLSSGGSVQVTGTGSATGIGAVGVMIDSAGVIAANSGGNLTVAGNGGGGAGNNNYGIFITGSNSQISGGTGNTQVTGAEGTGAGSLAIRLTSSGSIGSSSTTLTVIANSLEMSTNGALTAGVGAVNLHPRTNGVAIDLGGTTDSATGPLTLSVTEMAAGITANVLRIGDANSGSINITSGMTWTRPVLSLQSGSTISENTLVGLFVTTGDLALRAGGTISMDQGNSATNFAATTTSGSISYRESSSGGGLTIGAVDGLNGVSTNNAGINITTIDGALTIANTSSTTDIDAGSGTVALTAGQTSTSLRLMTINTGALVSGAGGATLTANDMSIATTGTSINAGSNIAILQTQDSGVAIDLGTNTAGSLGLTDAEIDGIAAGTLQIGNTSSGAITISSPLTRPASTNVALVSNGDIAISGGSMNTGGGTLSLSPGAAGAFVKPTLSGNDITASSTSFANGSDLAVNIAGATVDTQYTRFSVAGTVNLANVDLALTGAYVPVIGDSFTIVSADIVTGTFNGLASGAVMVFNGVSLKITYNAGSVVLAVVDNLAVNSFQATNSGFVVQFNKPIVGSDLNLYDQGNLLGPSDVTISGGTVGVVRGSLIVNAAGDQVTFVKTGGVLANDTYTVTLRSATNGFHNASSGLLDGNADGTSGDNYVATFTRSVSAAVSVGLPDFARGYGQAVNVPNTSTGLPVVISTGQNVSRVQFVLKYDPSLITITGFAKNASVPGSLQVDTSTPGQIGVAIQHSDEFSATSGTLTLGTFSANIPDTAAYGAKEILDISNLTVLDNSLTPQTRPSMDDDAVHVAAYFGDANGNRIIQSNDATLVARVGVSINTGYSSYQTADPVITSDISANGVVQSNDATSVVRSSLSIPIAAIPAIPTGIAPPATGLDPTLKLGSAAGNANDTITVPVIVSVPAGQPAVAFCGFDLRIQFDPTQLTFAGSTASAIASSITMAENSTLADSGLLAFGGYGGKTASLSWADGDTVLINLTFTVKSGAAGSSPLNLLRDNANFNGRTALFDTNADEMVLNPGPSNGFDAGVDATFTRTETPTTTSLVAVSQGPSSNGQVYGLTATVAPTPNAPAGVVTFYDGDVPISTVSISGNQATLNNLNLSLSTHNLKAVYRGNPAYQASTSTVVTLVVGASSALSVSTNQPAAMFGTAVTFTATLNVAGGGSASGSVAFFDNGVPLGNPAMITDNIATLRIASLSVGQHTITALYTGSAGSATPTAITQTVASMPPAVATSSKSRSRQA